VIRFSHETGVGFRAISPEELGRHGGSHCLDKLAIPHQVAIEHPHGFDPLLAAHLAECLSRIRAIHATAAPGEPAEERAFVEDPEALLELAKLSGYDAIRRFAPYLGKWMKISGTYEGIAKSLLRDSIHLSLLLHDGRRINLRFAFDREEELRGLQIGQRITAICQIQHLNFTLKPENCELVRTEPLRRVGRGMFAHVS